MNRSAVLRSSDRDKLKQFGALCYLFLLGGLALAGPYGVLAWGENLALLDKREARIAKLEKQRTDLRNRVALLDPDHVDPDMATELIRRDLNVVRPDEYIYQLDDR
jgi:cell division protein FtsB